MSALPTTVTPITDDPRDRALLSAIPTLLAPHHSRLPPPELGCQRFVLAQTGLFLQARTRALEISVNVAPSTIALPYGPVAEGVRFVHGPIPYAIYAEMRDAAIRRSPQEWVGYVVAADGGYRLIEPPVLSASAGHVCYATDAVDDLDIALSVHSHGAGEAYFSAQDDSADGQGIYVAVVLGRCVRADSVTAVARVVVNGRFQALATLPWTSPSPPAPPQPGRAGVSGAV